MTSIGNMATTSRGLSKATRVCRVASIPNSRQPGSGLAPFNLTRALGIPTLYVARRVGDVLVDLPGFVRLIRIRCPVALEPSAPQTGLLAALRKARRNGQPDYLLRAIAPMIRYRPDLVHVHGLISVPHALLGRVVSGARTAITFHNSTEIAYLRRYATLRRALRLFDRVFCMSQRQEDELGAILGNERVRLTRTAADGDLFRFCPNVRSRTISCIANLRWEKDLATLLRAFESLARSLPGYTLQIIGEGPERQALERIARTSPVADTIRFLGRRSQAEVGNAIRSSRATVLSSVSEGAPKVLSESIASGTPVVATDVGGCRDVVRDCGIVTRPGDPRELAAALRDVLGSDSAWLAFHENCRRARSRVCGWDRIAADTIREYEQLLIRSTARA